MIDVPEALAAEMALRDKRTRAIAAVQERLQAARTEAAGQEAAAATVVAALRTRVGQLQRLRDRLEVEHANAVVPAPAVVEAQAALAQATACSRSAAADDDAASAAAADAQAEAEDRLAAAKLEQARRARPLALRLETAIEQCGDAERELAAAIDAHTAAAQELHRVAIDLLRLRRDAAALALDAATFDLVGAGGAQRSGGARLTLGESPSLMAELGETIDPFFGGAASGRLLQHNGARFSPALLVELSEPPAPRDAIVRRVVRKSAALLEA